MSKAAELANLIGNINAGGGGANKNVIINGAMNVSKYGTTATGVGASDGYFTCDRWNFAQATNAGRLTMVQDINDAPEGFGNSLKLACTTADTSIGADEAALIQQRIEGQNLQTFKKGTSDAKPFALSFYVKGNASATYTAELFDNDNTRGNGQTFNVTTDWTRVELTFPADTTGAFDNDVNASLYFNIWLHAGSTYTGGTFTNGTWTAISNANVRVGDGTSFFDSTDRTFFITGVQLEVGQNPTEFEHENVKITEEKCRRYFIAYGGEKNYETIVGAGIAQSTTRCWFLYTPGQMRAIPTLTSANIQVDHPGVAGYAISSYTIDGASSSKGIFSYADVSSGLTAGKPYSLIGTSASDAGRGYVRLSAEL